MPTPNLNSTFDSGAVDTGSCDTNAFVLPLENQTPKHLPNQPTSGLNEITESGSISLNQLQEQANQGESFLSSVVLLLSLTVAQKAIGFIRAIVVCRLLPAEEMGLWAMVSSILTTILPLVLLSIPACFGRYFEHYRTRSQLRGFIWQASLICLGLLCLGEFLLITFRHSIATYTLGTPDLAYMIVFCAIAVIPFAGFSFCTEIMTALRYSKLTTVGYFINGMVLSVLAISFLIFIAADAKSMLLAFGLSYLVALAWLGSRLWIRLQQIPPNVEALPVVNTWVGMFPVIIIFWLNDFMGNMFYMSDRFMLVNLVPGDTAHVMNQIGNYESGHIIPTLISAVTLLIGKTLMPYLAKLWEAGNQAAVSQQTNLSIKAVGFCSIIGGLVFLPMSGFLFEKLFHGKYDGGAAILPYIVFFYICSGTSALVMNYFWCVQRASWAVLSLTAGLGINIAVNYALVPSMGITGAAIGTVFGVICQLSAMLILATRFGLKFDLGVLLLGLSSSLLLLDSRYAILWIIVAIGMMFIPGVFNQQDRKSLNLAMTTIMDHPKLSRLRRAK